MRTTLMSPVQQDDDLVGGELHQLQAVLEQVEQRGRDAERASHEFRRRWEAHAPSDRHQLAREAREIVTDLTTVAYEAARIGSYLDRGVAELDQCRAAMSSPEPTSFWPGNRANLAPSWSSAPPLTTDSSNPISR